MAHLIYSLLFALTVLSALMVVFSRHPVHSALFLVVTMISIAGIFIIINAQLAAVLQVLVYAGAIMVLFLFVIMLLNLGPGREPPVATRTVRRLGVLFFVVFLLQVSVLAMRLGSKIVVVPSHAESFSIADVSLALMTKYLYAFEMTSIMLLVALIGAMTLARGMLGSRITDVDHPGA